MNFNIDFIQWVERAQPIVVFFLFMDGWCEILLGSEFSVAIFPFSHDTFRNLRLI